jgi:hypothetical protein
VLQIAPTALSIVLAARRRSFGRGAHHRDDGAVGVTAPRASNAHPHKLPGQSPLHEDHETPYTTDSPPTVGEIGQFQIQEVPISEGGAAAGGSEEVFIASSLAAPSRQPPSGAQMPGSASVAGRSIETYIEQVARRSERFA